MIINKSNNMFSAGDKIGDLTVLEVKDFDNVVCSCICGKEVSIARRRLKNRQKCKYCHYRSMEKCEIPVGTIFNKWTTLTTPKVIHNKKVRQVLCRCACGNEHLVSALTLIHKKSTGCRKCMLTGHPVREFKYFPNGYLSHIKANAKLRKIEFNLTKDYLETLLETQNFCCKLSGVHLELPKSKKAFGNYNREERKAYTISLDRVDSDSGYIPGNVQFVHKLVNVMKQSLSDISFISICKLIAEHNCDKEKLDMDYIYKTTDHKSTAKKNANILTSVKKLKAA